MEIICAHNKYLIVSLYIMNQVNFHVMIICGDSWCKIKAFNVNLFLNNKHYNYIVKYFIECIWQVQMASSTEGMEQLRDKHSKVMQDSNI